MEEDSIMVARCRGICDIMRSNQAIKRPKTLPYLIHSHCRVCKIWFDKTTLEHPRCPCCSTILAILPRENHKKRVYREMLKHGV